MFLEKVKIKGFKSFAEPTVLKFEGGISSVVGPNGSGKSNIADAVRWALGETSAKSIRSKKGGDVIFAGSKKAKPANLAEVTLLFNNEDKKIPVEYSEVAITRRIFKNGDTEYLLNNQEVRLRDIQDLLMKAGVGQKTYSIIKQGTIEAILSASPVERKQMFDEATGIKEFQVKKERAERDLDKTKENLKHAGDLLEELKPRLRLLKRQAGKAGQRDEVEKSLRAKLWLWVGSRWIKNEKQRLAIETRNKQAAQSIIELSAAIKALEKDIEREEAGTDTEAIAALEKNLAQALEKKNRLDKDIIVNDGRLQVLKESRGDYSAISIKQQLEETDKNIAALEKSRDHLQTEKIATEKNIATLEKEQADLEKSLRDIFDRTDKIRRADHENINLDELVKDLQKIDDAHKDLAQKITAKAEHGVLTGLIAKIGSETKKIFSRLKNLALGEKAKNETLPKLEKDRTGLETKRNLTSSKLQENKINHAVLKTKLAEIDKNLLDLKKEAASLRRETDTHGQDHKTNKEENSLMEKNRQLRTQFEKADRDVADLQKKKASLVETDRANKKNFFILEKKYRGLQEELLLSKDKKNKIEVELARLATYREEIDAEAKADLTEPERQKLFAIKSTEADKLLDLAAHDYNLKKDIDKLKSQVEQIGSLDPEVVNEFEETGKRFEHLTTQSEDLKKASVTLRDVIKKLESKINSKFTKKFHQINTEFEKYFRVLFNGGHAKLILTEITHEDPDGNEEPIKEEIIDIRATPPGKNLKNLTMLSGGEKALTSLALLYAIMAANPSPFIVLDEVDAALDESNSKRFAKILHSLSKNTQFVLITHNRETMRQAQTLYGVTMNDSGVSKLLSIKLAEAEKYVD